MPKQIPGFPTYFIDSKGKVTRTVNGKTTSIKTNITKEGYGQVSLYKTVIPNNTKTNSKSTNNQPIHKTLPTKPKPNPCLHRHGVPNQ